MRGVKIELSDKQLKSLHKLIKNCMGVQLNCKKTIMAKIRNDLKTMTPEEVREKWETYGETLIAIKFMKRSEWKAAVQAFIDIAVEGS